MTPLFALIIQVGANIYSYDILTYSDLERCEYHKGKVEQLYFYTKNVTVTCTKRSHKHTSI